MLEFQEKRKVRKFLYSKITLVILAIIIILLLVSVFNVYKKQKVTRDNLAKTRSVLVGLEARERMLSSEIERLGTVNGIEKEIREKYDMVKPGEEVIVIIDSNSENSTSITPVSTSLWQKIKNWLQ